MTRRNSGWLAALIAWHGLIWWFSSQPELHSGLAHDFVWRKLAHVLEFAILFALWLPVLRVERISTPTIIAAWLLTLSYAVLDEWHQTWITGRYGTLRDVVIDMSGVTAAAVACWLRIKKPR